MRTAFGWSAKSGFLMTRVDEATAHVPIRCRQRIESAGVGLIFSYAHLPVIAYAELKHPGYGIGMSALIPQIGMAMAFVPLVVGLMVCGAALFAPSGPLGYLSAKFPGSAGEALIGIPVLLLFVSAYVSALFRVVLGDHVSRGWAALIIVWSISTNAFTIPVYLRNGNERSTKAAAEVRDIAEGLRLYKAEAGTYPTEQQGLAILTEPSSKAPKGYLSRLPIDTWGRAYHYRVPGIHNLGSVDVWSYGADGLPGGCGADRDLGNWDPADGSEPCRSSRRAPLAIAAAAILLALVGVRWRSRR